MATFSYKEKVYAIDKLGFLVDFEHWDTDFAEGMAPRMQINGGLTDGHWQIIDYIRETFRECRVCPLIYQTCRANDLRLQNFKELFPTGYLRGACLLAGLTYKEGFLGRGWPASISREVIKSREKAYRVDVRGFLIDAYSWDKEFAIHKAFEMKMEKLNDRHWQIIYFLREYYKKNYLVPTIFETCEANGMELPEMEKLFPDGYHRGAVKIAGLRVR